MTTIVQRHALAAHPERPPLALRGIGVDVERRGGVLHLRYRLDGVERVVLAPAAPPERRDGLWRTTCFELFLMLDDDERYVEFNFAPSGAWAAYAFDGYREGMVPLDLADAPRIVADARGVEVACDISLLPAGALRMALTAMVEEEGGVLSYWSLAHPEGMPDFHHAACFAARLPAPGAA